MHFGLVVQTPMKLGGGHGYEQAFTVVFRKEAERLGHQVTIFISKQIGNPASSKVTQYPSSPIRFALAHIRSHHFGFKLLQVVGARLSSLEKKAKAQGVDFLVFASPNHLAPGIQETPYSTTFWDFGHLDMPHGAELSLGGLWTWREELYRISARRSTAIFCESEHTSRRLSNSYDVPVERIFKVGLFPRVSGSVPDIETERPYIIYPAMFWPHKNHRVLLYAILQILKSGEEPPLLVLTGSGKHQTEIQRLTVELGLSEYVDFRGLTDRGTLIALMKGALGLVMPSALGPSNLPPLEAAILGLPVLASDSHEMDDLIHGVEYVSTFSPSAWAEGIRRLQLGQVRSPEFIEMDEESGVRRLIAYVEERTSPWRH